MDKKQEKQNRSYREALTCPANDKVAVIYSVKVCSVCIVPTSGEREKKGKDKKK